MNQIIFFFNYLYKYLMDGKLIEYSKEKLMIFQIIKNEKIKIAFLSADI